MKSPAFSRGPTLLLSDASSLGCVRKVCNISSRKAVASGVRMVSAAPVKEKVVKKEVKVTPERQTKKPNMYRLYIYNDPFNRRERVVDVLLKTCQGLTFSRAYAAMQEAHENGRGLVLIVYQEIAEHYCASINTAGVLSTIEPDN